MAKTTHPEGPTQFDPPTDPHQASTRDLRLHADPPGRCQDQWGKEQDDRATGRGPRRRFTAGCKLIPFTLSRRRPSYVDYIRPTRLKGRLLCRLSGDKRQHTKAVAVVTDNTSALDIVDEGMREIFSPFFPFFFFFWVEEYYDGNKFMMKEEKSEWMYFWVGGRKRGNREKRNRGKRK